MDNFRQLINNCVELGKRSGLSDRQLLDGLTELTDELWGNVWLDQHYKGDVPPRLPVPREGPTLTTSGVDQKAFV
jgi:hypothetical protein